MPAITFLSFKEWIDFVFDHPATGPEWYWAEDAPYWDAPARLTTEYVTRLFEDPLPVLTAFSDAEVNMGLNYLISPGLGEHMFCLDDPAVEIQARVRCVRSCESLFRQLFRPRCSPHLSHRDEPGRSPLNAVCYMWWDIMPVHGGPQEEDRRALHASALEIMGAILQMDSVACQESALHGLGHWHTAFPEETERMVDAFIRSHPHSRPDLLTYARGARCGCVL